MITNEDAERRLCEIIGRNIVEAVRALDSGEDPKNVLLIYLEATLSQCLKDTMTLARKTGVISNDELVKAYPSLSPSTISNRLKILETRGLLVKLEEQRVVNNGGRSYIYRVWDFDDDPPLDSYRITKSSTMFSKITPEAQEKINTWMQAQEPAITYRDIAQKTGWRYSYVWGILSGTRSLPYKFISDFRNVFGFDLV